MKKKIYLLASIFRNIAGQRTGVGTVKEIFDAEDLDQLYANIDLFLARLAAVIVMTMLQATSCGDLGTIEVNLDINNLNGMPRPYVVENPATSLGIGKSGSLTYAKWRKLEVEIANAADGICNVEMRYEVENYLSKVVRVTQW